MANANTTLTGRRPPPETDLEAVARAICADRGYEFGGRIGRGAFKETFLAVRPGGESFALKILKPGTRPDRVYREITAMHRCNHPNIVRLADIDTFISEGVTALYFSERFLSGGTLAQRLTGGRVLPPEEVRNLARQLAQAIGYLASVQLVHRDIKPENIMFGDDPAQPLLVDFGLVRDLASASLTQTRLQRGPGTPRFASPEQLNNRREEIDWRSDQFSLGVVLTMCAFGFHPYERPGDSGEDIADSVAAYRIQTERFIDAAQAAYFDPLIRMTFALPDQRFLLPEELLAAWPVV